MNATQSGIEARQEARALLARLSGHEPDPYERSMRNCLAAAQQALAACPHGPLLDALALELARLARLCERDAWRARRDADRAACSERDADAAVRIAEAARELSALATLKALAPGAPA